MQDACSLVDAFRAGELSPVEALDASLAAIDASTLNAFSFLDADTARATASRADVSLPFGGVPIGIKELDHVAGWPFTYGSLAFQDQRSDVDATQVARLRAAGVVPVGLTTASEFGFVGYTSTRLNGTTLNPWARDRTPGGSSGGSAAAVGGGLVPLCTAGDGGGSIRIPASFCGLLGLKHTYGRIPRGPYANGEPLTETVGCVSRSVRDTARWLDVCNGYDGHDRFSLPRVEGWEAALGTRALAGRRAVIAPDLEGYAVVHPAIAERVQHAAEELAKQAGLELTDVALDLPEAGYEWALAGLVDLTREFGHLTPDQRELLTDELRVGIEVGPHFTIDHMVGVERFRMAMIEALARAFEQVDFVLCATNPFEPFAADGPTPGVVGDALVNPFNAGALTIPANIAGYPAVSIPLGPDDDGYPVGLQVYARHHEEAWLLDLALAMERECPWPLVAPGAPV